MPLARPRKGRREVLDVSEGVSKCWFLFSLACFAQSDYAGPILWDKTLRTIAAKRRVVKVSLVTEAQGKAFGLCGFFKTLWEQTPSVGGI